MPEFRPEQVVGLVMANLATLITIISVAANISTILVLVKTWRRE